MRWRGPEAGCSPNSGPVSYTHLDVYKRQDPAQRKLAMKAIRESDWVGGPPIVRISPHNTFGLGV